TPSVSESTPIDLGQPPAPNPAPSTNPLFVEAQKGIPSARSASRAPEFQSIVRPFSAESFATGFVPDVAGIGPLAVLPLPDRSVLASGGPGRNQLFHFSAVGGAAGTPLATLAQPIFDLALDATGSLWATTGGGPLL